METVLQALQAMGKASSIEITARTGMDREQVVTDLWELKRAGVADKNGQTWALVDSESQVATAESVPASAENRALVPVKIDETMLTDAIRQYGPQSAEELAALFATTSRKVASTLAMATSKGRMIRVKQDGRFKYCLPGENLLSPLTDSAATDASRLDAAREDNDITRLNGDMASTLKSIPSFTDSHPDDLVIPTLASLAREIRRTELKLAQLEKCRAAVRELTKHKGLLQELLPSPSVEE